MTEEDYQLRIHELEKEISKLRQEIKRNSDTTYGLRWMDVPEASDGEDRIPILEEVKDKAIVQHDGQPTHILIEGDNYHALTCLNYTHKGKIDVIYIDPPYNTGSDGFVYKDKRVLDKFPDGTPVPTDHPLRHSYWLSFMEKRLRLAKNLLSDKGVIFISIGDDEIANLRLLCDKIFGEQNLLSIVPRLAKKGSDQGTHFRPTKDYTLAYAKEYLYLDGFADPHLVGEERIYPYKNSEGKLYRKGHSLYQASLDPLRGCVNQRYYMQAPDGTLIIPPGDIFPDKNEDGGQVAPTSYKDKVWRWSKDSYFKKKELIMFAKSKQSPLVDSFGNHTDWNAYEIKYQEDESTNVEAPLPNDMILNYTNALATSTLNSIGIDFSYSKPFELIQYLIEITNKSKDICVIDFFAGSGTTMHATMALNAEDGGHRQCILVQQQEDSKICEKVTYERNKRVMCGYTNSKGQYVDGLGGSLKYYRTDFVGEHCHLNATDNDRIALSQKAGNLLALAENTLQEITATNRYQIFREKDGDIATNGCMFTAVYFSDDLDKFGEFVQKIEQLQEENDYPHITIYLFCWDTPENYKEEFNNLRGLTLKAIPQPILDIYRRINN